MKFNVLVTIALALMVNAAFSCELEDRMVSNGLVDIATLDSTIKVEILNASTNNMLGVNSYGCLNKCLLRPEAAKKVINAQKLLKARRPGCSLKIFEGTRPRSVQRKMYEVVKNTSIRKYVADPAKGSMHNFGTAVDITIVDEKGSEIKMGKPDPRTKVVGMPDWEIKLFFIFNHPNRQEIENRELLKSIMTTAGFHTVSYEWWHFDSFSKGYVRQNFRIIE